MKLFFHSRQVKSGAARMGLALLVSLAAVVHCPLPHSAASAAEPQILSDSQVSQHGSHKGAGHRRSHSNDAQPSSEGEHGSCAASYLRPSVSPDIGASASLATAPVACFAEQSYCLARLDSRPGLFRSGGQAAAPLTLLSQRVLIRI
jgi:hypothetical protein